MLMCICRTRRLSCGGGNGVHCTLRARSLVILLTTWSTATALLTLLITISPRNPASLRSSVKPVNSKKWKVCDFALYSNVHAILFQLFTLRTRPSLGTATFNLHSKPGSLLAVELCCFKVQIIKLDVTDFLIYWTWFNDQRFLWNYSIWKPNKV